MILFLRISLYLLFQVHTCKTPHNVWTKLKDFLGKEENTRGHHLENYLHALNTMDLETLHDYFCKFKTFLSHVKACGIDKKENS
jgi:hypothetical protein